MDEHIHPDELESAPREQEELNVGPVEARNVGAIAGSAKKTRSKSGCLVCRSRRVKCDGGMSTSLVKRSKLINCRTA